MRKSNKFVSSAVAITLMLANLFVYSVALAAPHAAGTNVISNGTIYMITDDGQRRPYTSAGAFLSYGFNSWASVQQANADDMALPEGSFIPPRDGKIVCSDRGADKGTCYLITNGKRAAFVSGNVFTSLGFSFSKALSGDVSFLPADADITAGSEQHRPGVLINRGGTIYLVVNGSLLGIPSMAVLNTWGYTLSDAVSANSSDAVLSQSSVIESRVGARLSPNETKISESSLVQGYIDSYPDLPTTTINAPEEAARVLDLVKAIQASTGTTIDSIYPYLSSNTIRLLNSAPTLKSYVDEPSAWLLGMVLMNSNVQVFEGSTKALFTEYKGQQYTNYQSNIYWVCVKENGSWKWDLVGTWKHNDKIDTLLNPTNAFVTGNGVSDISLVDADYSEYPKVNDENTFLALELRNSGATTIHNFHLVVRVNGTIVYDSIESYVINPAQTVYVAVPISLYWKISGTDKNPGNYTTDINIGFDSSPADNNQTDNHYNFMRQFQANDSVIKI